MAAFAIAVLLPLGLFAYGVRRQMDARLTSEDRARAAVLVDGVHEALDAASADVGTQLARIAAELAASSRFRLAAVDGAESERRWLLDYAASAMRGRGLDALQLQDVAGRIVSSGHFRNQYDEPAPELPDRLARLPAGAALAGMPTPDDTMLVLTRIDSLVVGGQRFRLVGGIEVDSSFLRRTLRDPSATVHLVLPEEAVGIPGEELGAIELPYVESARPAAGGTARFVVARPASAVAELRRDVTRWLAGTAGLTLLLALAVAAWLATRVSRPIRELAEKTAAVDLDRLDQQFATGGDDEVGSLSRLLDAMTARLRVSSVRLREAERRAATGDLARQVTHDIKNGLAPIRHVLRHLGQVAEDEPSGMAAVYAERRATLESSVGYLETLARRYAELRGAESAEAIASPVSINAIARDIASGFPTGTDIRLQLDPTLPTTPADPVALRRILENLIGNAVDSLDGKAGTVTVTTAHDARGTTISIADTGHGMSRTELDRAFEDFFTTKPTGTGLGLSVVRRMVADLGGSMQVATEPGAGTRFDIHLPAAS